MEKVASHYVEVTHGVYSHLERPTLTTLLNIQDRILEIESGEAVPDELIAEAADEQAELYGKFYEADTVEAIKYLESDDFVLSSRSSRKRPTNNGLQTVFSLLEKECQALNVPPDLHADFQNQIINGWDAFTDSASDYILAVHRWYSHGVAALVRPNADKTRQYVAEASRASFNGLLRKLEVHIEQQGPLPPKPSSMMAAARELRNGERSRRDLHVSQSDFYVNGYSVPDPAEIIRHSLKQDYLRVAKRLYGEVPIDPQNGLRDVPALFLNLHADNSQTETLSRPMTPVELAEELVIGMAAEMVYGNTKIYGDICISKILDVYGSPAQLATRQIRREVALGLEKKSEDGVVVLPSTPVPARKDPFQKKVKPPREDHPMDARTLAEMPKYRGRDLLRLLEFKDGQVVRRSVDKPGSPS
jgi:hypothetical protein